MTDTQLTTESNIIKNETISGSNTASRVGIMLNDIIANKINNDKIDVDGTLAGNSDVNIPSQKAVKTYVDANSFALPYKVLTALLTFQYNGTDNVLSLNILKNDFIGVTFTGSEITNGVLRITASGSAFTNSKTFIQPSFIDGGSVPYFVNAFNNNTTIVTIDIYKYDGTMTGTPYFTNMPLEIRVYN
jgi:hypothetical protein